MRNLSFAMALVGLCGLWAACSDDSTPTDAIVLSDGPGLPDAGPDAPLPDLAPPDMKLTDGRVAGLLGTVADSLTWPAAADKYAKDIDGDGTAENQLGAILGPILTAMNAAGMDLQAETNAQIAGGTVLLLFELFATSLTDDPAMKVQFHQGQDPDSDPSNNFTGSAVLGIASTSPADVKLDGKITGGKMEAGPGNFIISIPGLGLQPIDLSLNNATLVGDVSAGGIANGQLNGAIPWTDVDQKLIPAIALLLDALVQDPQTPASTVGMILTLFDTNGDNSISADEIRNNGLLTLVLKPDLDLDKDGTKESMSAGVAFTAVSCIIQ